MSDKFQKITVILDREYNSESIEKITSVLKMVKHVADAVPGEPMNQSDYIARSTVLQDFIGDLYGVMALSGSFASQEDRTDWEQIKDIAQRARKRRGF